MIVCARVCVCKHVCLSCLKSFVCKIVGDLDWKQLVQYSVIVLLQTCKPVILCWAERVDLPTAGILLRPPLCSLLIPLRRGRFQVIYTYKHQGVQAQLGIGRPGQLTHRAPSVQWQESSLTSDTNWVVEYTDNGGFLLSAPVRPETFHGLETWFLTEAESGLIL